MSEFFIPNFDSARKAVDDAKEQLTGLQDEIKQIQQGMEEQFNKLLEDFQVSQLNPKHVKAFRKKPYAMIPRRVTKGKIVEWFVIVPRFVDFHLPQLDHADASYNYFLLNSYTHHFGEIPAPLQKIFRLSPLPDLKVVDGMLLTPEEIQEQAWKQHRKHLVRREGKSTIRIKRGHEFYVIAEIIERGGMPFVPNRVEEEDLRTMPATDILLKDYQQEAYEKFLSTGAVGVFWPYSVGKSYFGLYCCAALKGPKLVVTPNSTLKEKWIRDLREKTTIADEVRVENYQSYHKVKDEEYVLTVFEECHHLPARTFIRLATLKTKYRMGFSGSPFREDGKTDYIIALTGYPIGLSWQKFFELGIIGKPKITVYIVANKLRKLAELLQQDVGKTIIFCDGIPLGKRIARIHGLEHVYSETKNRLDVIAENDVLVVSRVGDEGISLPELDTLIEVDFLYGSRMQEGQRSGRLLHSQKESTNHYILMTEDELAKYGKRLFALYEKGFEVNIIR